MVTAPPHRAASIRRRAGATATLLPPSPSTSLRRRLTARGAVTVEYIVLVASVGIVIAGALFAFGPSFVSYFETTRGVALVPAP